MSFVLVNTLYDFQLADDFAADMAVTPEVALALNRFFQTQHIFNWHHTHNFCEARAEAMSLLLTAWNIPHAKSWVFGAAFLYPGYVGGLKYNWNYHVAVALPVLQNGQREFWVIDPSTQANTQTVYQWADAVTLFPHSYHFVKLAQHYIFPTGKILRHNWHQRNFQNYEWVIQGLAGINGLTQSGKAALIFHKALLRKTRQHFKAVFLKNPLLGNAIAML